MLISSDEMEAPVVTIRCADGGPEIINRAEVDVSFDGDKVRIEVRRIEDDPQVELVVL